MLISLILLILNAFFVAAEFALVASKRHRLEQAADAGSRAGRAAVAGSRELSLMLAGAQLGITVCTLGLGALAEPAVAQLFDPILHTLGMPAQASHAAAFLIALAFVVFLHMVVGEMAPKSWAISHPETSAVLLALPFRAFARIARPALAVLNGLANGALRLAGVTPQDELAQAHGPDELRMLIGSSRELGHLPPSDHRLLTSMLALQNITVRTVMTPAERIVSVPIDATAAEIEQVSRLSGRSRLTVTRGDQILGVVHVREAVRATTRGQPATATELMTPPFAVGADQTVVEAVQAMRENRAQLAIVTDGDPAAPTTDPVGLVALEDLLEQVIGEFDDETDPIVAATR